MAGQTFTFFVSFKPRPAAAHAGVGRLTKLRFTSAEQLPSVVALLRQQLVLTQLIESCVYIRDSPGRCKRKNVLGGEGDLLPRCKRDHTLSIFLFLLVGAPAARSLQLRCAAEELATLLVDFRQGSATETLRVDVGEDCKIRVSSSEAQSSTLAGLGRMQAVLSATFNLPLALAAFFNDHLENDLLPASKKAHRLSEGAR